MPIPKIIHQIWIQGYDHLPDELKKKHELIKKFNPDYKVILWDETMILKLLKKYDQLFNFYNNVINFSGFIKINPCKSDIARLVIIYEYGGFYIDIDYFCPLSLNMIYNKNDEIITTQCEYKIAELIPFIFRPKYGSSFMAMIKKHPLFPNLFKEIVQINNRNDIGSFLDKYLQNSFYKIRLIDPKYVSPHTSSETGICFTPKKSSSFFGRDILIFIGNNYKYILLFILLFIIVWYIG